MCGSWANACVSAQLLEIGSGRQLWADRYDRQLEDIFAIQDEVASRVAAMVSGHVDNAKRVQSERKPAKDVTAYELVLRADWLFHKDYSSPEGIRLLEKALERDPDYALAHAYLAMHHAYNLFGAGLDIEEADRLTRAHGGAASRLSPEDAAVHAAISEAYLIIGDFELATYHADTALALNPHEYHSRVHASLVRSYTGRHAEALELIEHLQQNDPYAAISARETIFEIHYLAERYEAALASMTGRPNPPAHMLLEKAAALAQLGRMSEAEVEFQRFESEWPETWSITDLVQSYRRMCARPEEWEKWLEGFRKAGLNV